MQAIQSPSLRLPVFSVFLFAGGLFVTTSIVASNMIWPASDDLGFMDVPELAAYEQATVAPTPPAKAPNLVNKGEAPVGGDVQSLDTAAIADIAQDAPSDSAEAAALPGPVPAALLAFAAEPVTLPSGDAFEPGMITGQPTVERGVSAALVVAGLEGSATLNTAELFPVPAQPLQLTAPANSPVKWQQLVDHDRVLAVTQTVTAPAEERAIQATLLDVLPHTSPAPNALVLPDFRVASLSREAMLLPPRNLPRVAVEQEPPVQPKIMGNAPQPLGLQGAKADLVQPPAAMTSVAALPNAPVLSPVEVDVRPIDTPPTADLAAARAMEPAPVEVAESALKVLNAPHQSPRPPVRPRRMAQKDVSPSPVPPSAQPTPAAAPLPANTKAAATAVAARSGSRVAVIGVFQTRNESWALLQLADGRIVKAAKGMDLSAFKVTRVDANKIWIRNGNSEKGLRTGDVFQVN